MLNAIGSRIIDLISKPMQARGKKHSMATSKNIIFFLIFSNKVRTIIEFYIIFITSKIILHRKFYQILFKVYFTF